MGFTVTPQQLALGNAPVLERERMTGRGSRPPRTAAPASVTRDQDDGIFREHTVDRVVVVNDEERHAVRITACEKPEDDVVVTNVLRSCRREPLRAIQGQK